MGFINQLITGGHHLVQATVKCRARIPFHRSGAANDGHEGGNLCICDLNLSTNSQWIGLRENLQETMVFTIKYRGFL